LFIRSYNATYNPGGRYSHSANLVKNKLYVAGGYSTKVLNDIFYLDLSSSFTLDNPPFVNDVTTPNLPIAFDCMACIVGGKDNSTIFLFGGWEGVS